MLSFRVKTRCGDLPPCHTLFQYYNPRFLISSKLTTPPSSPPHVVVLMGGRKKFVSLLSRKKYSNWRRRIHHVVLVFYGEVLQRKFSSLALGWTFGGVSDGKVPVWSVIVQLKLLMVLLNFPLCSTLLNSTIYKPTVVGWVLAKLQKMRIKWFSLKFRM